MQEIICDFQVAIGKGEHFVVRVHSDNDNSLIAEVKDYLRKECIEQTFTSQSHMTTMQMLKWKERTES